MFILRSTTPHEADAERELRAFLINLLGPTDEQRLTQWLWEQHPGPTYLEILAGLVRECSASGRGRAFFDEGIFDLLNKPKERREAEIEIGVWARRELERSITVVRGHRGDPEVARAEFDRLCHALEEKLWSMFPRLHRATMKGSIVSAFTHEGGKYQLNIARLVESLMAQDPLAATAAASR